MENNKHIPGPWTPHYHKTPAMMFARVYKEDTVICEVYNIPPIIGAEISKANTERIVECVNALEGISDVAKFVSDAKSYMDHYDPLRVAMRTQLEILNNIEQEKGKEPFMPHLSFLPHHTETIQRRAQINMLEGFLGFEITNFPELI